MYYSYVFNSTDIMYFVHQRIGASAADAQMARSAYVAYLTEWTSAAKKLASKGKRLRSSAGLRRRRSAWSSSAASECEQEAATAACRHARLSIAPVYPGAAADAGAAASGDTTDNEPRVDLVFAAFDFGACCCCCSFSARVDALTRSAFRNWLGSIPDAQYLNPNYCTCMLHTFINLYGRTYSLLVKLNRTVDTDIIKDHTVHKNFYRTRTVPVRISYNNCRHVTCN